MELKEAHFKPTQVRPCSVVNLTIVKDQGVIFVRNIQKLSKHENHMNDEKIAMWLLLNKTADKSAFSIIHMHAGEYRELHFCNNDLKKT